MKLEKFLKIGYHYLIMSISLLFCGIWITFSVYQHQNQIENEITALKNFISQNPSVTQGKNLLTNKKVDEDFILIQFEKIAQEAFNSEVQQISVKKFDDNTFNLEFSINSNYKNVIDFEQSILLNSPLNPNFPFLVSSDQQSIDFAKLNSPNQTEESNYSFAYKLTNL